MTRAAAWHGGKARKASTAQPRSIERMRAHWKTHLSERKRGNNHRVKFSRAMWDRLLRDQNEFAALKRVTL